LQISQNLETVYKNLWSLKPSPVRPDGPLTDLARSYLRYPWTQELKIISKP